MYVIPFYSTETPKQPSYHSFHYYYYFCFYFTFSFYYFFVCLYSQAVSLHFAHSYSLKFSHILLFLCGNHFYIYIYVYLSLTHVVVVVMCVQYTTKSTQKYRQFIKWYTNFIQLLFLWIRIQKELYKNKPYTRKKKWYRKDLIVHHYECV